MMRSLYGRLAAVLVAIFAVVAAAHLAITVVTTRFYQQEIAQKLNRDLASNLAKEKILLRDGIVDRGALEEVFHMLMVINPSIELYLLDARGEILAFSAPPGKVVRQSVSLAPIRRFLSGSATLPIRGDDPRGLDRRKVFSAAVIRQPDQSEPQGYLYVILGGEEYDSAAGLLEGSFILRLGVAVGVGGALFALATSLLLFARLTRRLRRLSRRVDEFRASDFTSPLAQEPNGGGADEIASLASSFEEMSSRIVEQVEELKKTDALRRDLVANISHDLRTPLAALQGYIDTLLLKDETLSAEERRRSLGIAATHCEKLRTLISDLFELSRLEANETAPQLERCSMAELVQDVVQRFRLQAEAKGVRLVADYATDLPDTQVDIRLIERVLQNLIENAIRYTPEGGDVTVSAQRDIEGGVNILVTDTGVGIPEEELPLVFQRFYRADRTERADARGLGLAIAKKIVELHGSRLEIASRIREGTTFKFRAPFADASR